MAIFIRIDVDKALAADATAVKRLCDVCPVDIFATEDGGGLRILDENVDECTLCELCLDVGRPGQVVLVKLYDDDATLQRG